MTDALIFENDSPGEAFNYFYQAGDFYFMSSVNSQFPFNSPGRGRSSVAYEGDFTQGLEYWARLMLGKKPNEECVLVKGTNKPGIYHPRMWRGQMEGLSGYVLAGSQSVLSKSLIAGDLIVQRLHELFTFIEPIPQNQTVYSHRIRELLLLSCMEVESSWLAILKANGYPLTDRPTTADYVKLLGPLLLTGYEVEYSMYPEIGIVQPFKDWVAARPTKSLTWYDDYNNTKHNREDKFHHATLANVISAVSAVAILLCAQFGSDAIPEGIDITLKDVARDWSYIPLGNATRNVNPDGSTQGIGWNHTSTWNKVKYPF